MVLAYFYAPIRKTMSNCRTCLTTLLICLIFPALSFANDHYPKNPDIDVDHYCFRISLNDSTDRIEGTAGITVRVTGHSNNIILDLIGLHANGKGMTVSSVSTGTSDLKFVFSGNRLSVQIPDSISNSGLFMFTVRYSGIPADGLIISTGKFGNRTFFGDNWPDRARNWLPCIDHPSDKATVEFYVTAPEKYKVVANGYLAGEYVDPGSFAVRRKVTHWKEDVPVPTKVMVIGVADFAWEISGLSKGVPVESWVYTLNREAGFMDYSPAAGILSFYQDLIGPYSYEKLANVQSKTMFGGMENSGCIFYYEGSVTGKGKLQSLLAHEIAHQWFGDAVTEKDWHHVWLSEGFATYLEACYADSLLPGRSLENSMAEMRKDVIRFYERTNKPVIDTTITNYMDLLSTNSYSKGAWVLHMLRQELGDRIFWKGIREFYATYRDKNALTSDLQTVMQEVSGSDLGNFFHQWLEVPGQPVLKWSWKYDNKSAGVVIDLEQMQTQYDFSFSLPVMLSEDTTGINRSAPAKSVIYHVPVNTRSVKITLPADFVVSEVKLDPACQLLFQDLSQKKPLK